MTQVWRERLEACGVPRALAGQLPETAAWRVDSRHVHEGDVFVMVDVPAAAAADYAADAVRRGACLLAGSPDLCDRVRNTKVPVLCLPGSLVRPDALAAHLWPVDWTRVLVVAVTGTNGKTSCTHQIVHGAAKLGNQTAVIGTVGYHGPGWREAATLTTPPILDLQRLLYLWSRDGRSLTVALEASSHALAQGRLAETPVDAAVVTNIAHDHLDYHRDLETYRAAKAAIFTQPLGRHRVAVVPADDHALVTAADGSGRRCLRFGSESGEVRRRDLTVSATGSTARFELWTGDEVRVRLAAPGAFQQDNAAAALATLVGLGHSPAAAAEALCGWAAPPGRLEPVATHGVQAYVDYAHTPEALRRSIETLRAWTSGKVIVVFGCGGDRDRDKRPRMGHVAAAAADTVVLTSDNPRSEDPAAIVAEIRQGMPADSEPKVVLDRRRAIRTALGLAGSDDVVLIAGKGHETEQIFADRSEPFDDHEELLQWHP